MRFVVYVPLLVPLVAAPAAKPLAARLDPRHATWLLTVAALVLAGASTCALGLLVANAVIRIPFVDHMGNLSTGVVHRNTTASVTIALVAAAVLVPTLIALSSFAYRRFRAVRSAWADAACLPRGGPVVTDDSGVDAYALPGRPGRIVVSTGMLGALDKPSRVALLAHEEAHVRCHHYAFTSVAELAAAANPLLRPFASAVEYTVERWADESAAAEVGDRRQVAVSIGRAALAAKTSRPQRRIGLALGAVFAGPEARAIAAAGPVPRRVAALLDQAPRRRLVLLASAVLVLTLTGVTLLLAANDLQDLLSLAHHHGRYVP